MKANSSGQPGFVFAADLGGPHLRSAIVDNTGKLRFRIQAPTPKVIDPNEIVRELVVAAREDNAGLLGAAHLAFTVHT